MKTEKKEAKEGLSFRGYASEGAFRGGMVGAINGVRIWSVAPTGVSHRCEVVFLADDAPDAPPVGSVVGKKDSSDNYQVLTTPYKNKVGGWSVVVENMGAGTVFTCSLSALTTPRLEQEFTITLKGTEQDAEHLKKIMKDHELEVVVEPVS